MATAQHLFKLKKLLESILSNSYFIVKVKPQFTFLNKKVTVQQLLLVFLISTNLLLSIIKSQYLVLLTSTVIVD